MLLSKWFDGFMKVGWQLVDNDHTLYNSHPYDWAHTLVKQEKNTKREKCLSFDMGQLIKYQMLTYFACILEVNLPLC